jgi:hypothetical protein
MNRTAIALAAAVGLSACALVTGLDGFSKVDCVDCADEAGAGDATSGEPAPQVDAPVTCSPACSGATPVCDPTTLKCVACLTSKECGPGFLCFDNTCKPGCSASHPECAPDGGRCDLEAGVCKAGCIVDADCTDPSKPMCDTATGQCTVCLPQNDKCPSGKFCAPASAGEYECAVGCNTVQDCSLFVDGGPLPPSVACCNHRCFDTSADLGHCGSCGNSCVPEGGNPGLAACCNSACVDTGSSATHCGSCTNVCSTNNVPAPACTVGTCTGVCAPGTGDCNSNKLTDGCETDLLSNVAACGGCGLSCSTSNVPTPSCLAGQCNGACSAGFADCNLNKQTDGCESNLAIDPQHCGGCANVCSNNHIATPTCTAGACTGVCTAPYADCDANKLFNGCEVDTGGDPAHCGGCANVCSTNNVPTPTCAAGVCDGACGAGFADCNTNKLTDGCEVNTNTDANNCGACGTACSAANMATRTCGAGACNGACAAGFADCNNNKRTDGCEINTMTDKNNCGGCGAAFACGSGFVCQSGSCVVSYTEGASPQGFIDACTTGTAVTGSPFLANADDSVATGTLPFALSFYGAAQSTFWLSSNGAMGFGAPPLNSGQFTFVCPLPNSAADPVFSLMVFGDDLVAGPAGVCASTVGSAPNRKFVVTWEHAYLYPTSPIGTPGGSTSNLQFSAIFSETTNTIDIVYNVMTDTNAGFLAEAHGGLAVVGVQNAGPSLATQFSCHTQSETPGTAIRFTP